MHHSYLEPFEFAPGSYWVGKREPGQVFFANPYLRVFQGQNPTGDDVQFNMIIDPGSSSDFAIVRSKLTQVLGGPEKTSAVFINHQDPDVGSSASMLVGKFAPEAVIMTSEETWRLIHHQNLPAARFADTNNYPSGVRLPTGQIVLPVPSPYCHFVGAVMLYDPDTRVLYSGDLFGGLTDRAAEGMWADESDWPGMRAFHQLYMPSSVAIRRVMQTIRQLTPAVEIIAPQHGRLIRGPLVETFMQRLENLPVGVEILEDRQDDRASLVGWTTVLSRVITAATGVLGQAALGRLSEDGELSACLDFSTPMPTITQFGKRTVERAVRVLTKNEPPVTANVVNYEAILAAEELDLPAPRIDIEGMDQGGGAL